MCHRLPDDLDGGWLTEARCLFEGGFRTNPDDLQSVALSDHLPVLAAFANVP